VKPEKLAPLPNPAQCPTISVPTAGRYLGLSVPSAYKAAKSGQIPTIRIGGRLLVSTAQFRRLVGLDEAA
jgi:excisionase family DNA binding protein